MKMGDLRDVSLNSLSAKVPFGTVEHDPLRPGEALFKLSQ